MSTSIPRLQLSVQLLLLWIGSSCCDAFIPLTIYHTASTADIQRYFALKNVGRSQDVVSDDPTINERRPIFTSTTLIVPKTSSLTEAVSVSTTADDDVMVDVSLQPLLRPTTTQPQQLRVNATTIPDTTTSDQNDNDQRTVLLLLWSIAAISALDRVAMSVALVPMSSSHDGASVSAIITDTTKGLISSYFSVGYGLAIVPAGLLVSFVSPKSLMMVGILTWSVATLATPVAADWMLFTSTTALVPILLIRSLVGMGEAILIPTVHRLLSVWTTRQQKSSGTWLDCFGW
jgi:Major Facilitator Superfamily